MSIVNIIKEEIEIKESLESMLREIYVFYNIIPAVINEIIGIINKTNNLK